MRLREWFLEQGKDHRLADIWGKLREVYFLGLRLLDSMIPVGVYSRK